MKVLFLHLSDMHFSKSDIYIPDRAKSIVKAVCADLSFEEVYVFVSGDIAQSGQKDEYGIAKKFFGTLVKGFENSRFDKPRIFIVPGNHDVNFKEKQRSRSDVVELKKNITKKIIEAEYDKLSEFWNFAIINNCFRDNKEIDITTITTRDNTIIQVDLINSALFSLYKDKLNDGDEGVHYISSDSIKLLKKQENCAVSISMMHHSEEYFAWDTRSELRNILKNGTDLLLLGHDHNASTCSIESNLKGNTVVVRGGCLNSGNLVDGTFDAIIYDTQTKETMISQYDWSDSNHIYYSTKINNYYLNSSLKNDEEFCHWLESSESALISKNYLDYFVFPRLTIQSDYTKDDECDRPKDLLTIEDLKKAIEHKNLIELVGDDLSGKTTLIKYLYLELKKNYIPLVISSDDIVGRIDKIIRNAYERQYSYDKSSFDEYIQEPKDRKIVLIDDINSIEEKKRQPLLKYLLEKFEIVFYTNNTTSDFNIKRIIEDLLENSIFNPIKIKIEPFYSDKRKELIGKICKCVQCQYDEKELELTVNRVNGFIKNQLSVFSLNPEFIALFTRSFVLNIVDNSNTNAFNAVFSNNLSSAIEKHKSKTKAQDDLIILQEFAALIHFHKKYPADLDDFKNCVDSFNEAHRSSYFYLDVIEELVNAKILKHDKNEISFYNKTYLSFFVAKWINRKIQNGSGIDQLKNVVNNLCYNINADILLFLTYITENISVLYQILFSEQEYTKTYKELNIDKNDISILTESIAPFIPMKLPDTAEKNKLNAKEVELEKRYFENEDIKRINIYDEELDVFEVQQRRLLKYLDLITKILPCFAHLLETKQQDDFIKEIYRLPNKIAYFLFQPLEENKEALIEELKHFFNKNHPNKELSDDEIKVLLSRLLTSMLLTLYDIAARNCSSDRTILALDSFDYKSNTCYYIQNIMMHENLRKFNQYVERSDELFDNTDSEYVKLILRKIFRKHCLDNTVLYRGEGQKYIDKYLGCKNIVALRLTHSKKD